MYVRKRIGKRRSFFQKHRLLVFFLGCLGAGILGFLLRQSVNEPVQTIRYVPMETADAPIAQETVYAAKYERTLYPYSVIPGGVRTRTELVSKIIEDPVVASHYANFEIDQARFVKSEETQFVHVAYRLRNKIFWTAKKVEIPKGETLISDGKSIARTRCGNKVSVLPQEPISAEEPPIETFEIPVFEVPMIAKMEPPQLDISAPPVSDLEIRPVDPLIPYVPIAAPLFDNLRYGTVRPLALFPRFYEVPEPGTISLTILGLVSFMAVRLRRKK